MTIIKTASEPNLHAETQTVLTVAGAMISMADTRRTTTSSAFSTVLPNARRTPRVITHGPFGRR
ncbi:MAG: hypothetical protein ABI216_12670, partial [Devosia sp.]